MFVGYSTSIFLKSRGKEFGLLSLYGMTRKQIKKYVLIENTILSILSIGTGILTGIAFSKLFFMIMEGFLGINLPFNISLKALGLTCIIFFALFKIISTFMLFQIRNKEIIEQIKSSKVPKTIPKFSKAKAILGITLLIIGYIAAWFVQDVAVVLAMIPVTLIVIAGTYFLFTQFSIAVANRILKNESLLYNKINFFIASGSIIYFKLFNEIKQDGIEYGILRKIGTTEKEINKIITKQIGIIFFLPFVEMLFQIVYSLFTYLILLMKRAGDLNVRNFSQLFCNYFRQFNWSTY